MIFSLVAMTGLEKCYITSAYLHSLCHSGERPVARGPLVLILVLFFKGANSGVLKKTLSSEKHVKTCIYVSLHVMPDNAEYWPIHLRAFTC